MSRSFRKIASSALFVSEPHPAMFGNRENEPDNKNWSNENWLKSRFHFSFAEYHNPRNSNFGALRVMNDDLVQPRRGFGTHPHSNMEICTYVVDGFLTHKDSMGTAETLSRGAVQYMSAGTGVRHSEHNLDEKSPLRFIQMWIVPRKNGLPPRYGSASPALDARKNKFLHLVSDTNDASVDTPVKVHQDVNLHVAEADDGVKVAFSLKEGRQAYLLCVEGSEVVLEGANAGGDVLSQYDAAALVGPAQLEFTPRGGAGHILVVEMSAGGSRRDEF